MNKSIIFFSILIIIQACKPDSGKVIQNEKFRLDSLVNTFIIEKKIPSIAVGIVKDGKVVLGKGYGYADVKKKTKADEHTIYQLGSVTKMFTGHMLAQLIHQEEMTLSDTLSDFFASTLQFPRSPTGQVVTIKEIATHTSEFPRYPENLKREDPHPIKGYSIEEMIKGIELVSIDTVIGVRYNYSNFGYGILGTAMGNHMKKNLANLMEEYIFSDYKMKSSSLVFKDDFGERLATPYLEVSPLVKTEPWNMESLSGAGNLFSSVSDLNLFMIELLSENDINKIQQTEYFKISDNWSYGLGCFIVDSKKRNTIIIYHGGDIDGYASELSLYPEYDLGIVILTNWGEGSVIGKAFTAINSTILNYYAGTVSQ